MTECGSPNPDKPEMLCDKRTPCWGYHASGTVTWDGNQLPTKTSTGRKSRILASATPAYRTGPAVAGGAPQQVLEALADGDWVAGAKEVLHEVCLSQSRFTTGDMWPRLNAPPEKRQMVVVIRYGLSRGWMVEESAVRENGEYTTRDGQSFRLNKLVPIYKSMLYLPGR